jgi:hypothetical protein
MCQSQNILYVTHTLYLVSDLEGSDNGDPLYGIMMMMPFICSYRNKN